VLRGEDIQALQVWPSVALHNPLRHPQEQRHKFAGASACVQPQFSGSPGKYGDCPPISRYQLVSWLTANSGPANAASASPLRFSSSNYVAIGTWRCIFTCSSFLFSIFVFPLEYAELSFDVPFWLCLYFPCRPYLLLRDWKRTFSLALFGVQAGYSPAQS